MEDSLIVVYRIDQLDSIIFANDDWDRFAVQNDSKHLQRVHILGRRIWECISDSDTEQMYRDMLIRVRSGRPVSFQYHCDSPEMRRLLEMHVTRIDAGMVQFTSSTVALTPGQAIDLLDPHRDRAGAPVRICSWCKRVEVEGEWIEPGAAMQVLNLQKVKVMPPLAHSMCKACYDRVQQAMGESGGARQN